MKKYHPDYIGCLTQKNTELKVLKVLNKNNIKNKKFILKVLSEVDATEFLNEKNPDKRMNYVPDAPRAFRQHHNSVLKFLVDYTGLNFELAVHLLNIVNPKILTKNINQYFSKDYYGSEYCNA